MALIARDFDSYKIYYSNNEGPPPRTRAEIHCLRHGQFVGFMEFFDDGDRIPDPKLVNERIVLAFKLSRFNDVVCILRQEKPLHLLLNLDANAGWLATSEAEPVGEQVG